MQGGAGCCRAHIVDPRQEVEEPRAVVEAARVGRRLGGADEALRDRVRVGGRGRGRGRGRVRARVRVGVRVRAMVRVRVRVRGRAGWFGRNCKVNDLTVYGRAGWLGRNCKIILCLG